MEDRRGRARRVRRRHRHGYGRGDIKAYKLVAATEGIFCEPARAASIAGVIKLNNLGYYKGEARIVCTLTGHGLKDPDTAIKVSTKPLSIKGTMEEVVKALGY